MNQQEAAPGSILDQIYEKVSNIEYQSNTATTRKNLLTILRSFAKKEKSLRASTITIKHKDKINHDAITKLIEDWVHKTEALPPTFWQDKEATYCQFTDQDLKNNFLDKAVQDPSLREIAINILPPNMQGNHFTRKEVKVEIANARSNIRIERVREILELTTVISSPIDNIREGKPNKVTGSRSILFRTGSQNIEELFLNLDGVLPYSNLTNNSRSKLTMKINAKPWQCRDCYALGYHQCSGKRCLQCGAKDHDTKTCKIKTKLCVNCNRKGHRAKDTHCPRYLDEVAKEIRKMDIPISCIENKNTIARFLKHIQMR